MTEAGTSERHRSRSARLLALCAAAIALLLWSQPAAGQYGQPAPPPPRDYPTGGQQQRQTLAPQAEVLRAAACLAGRDAAAGERLLATAPYSADEREEALRTLRLVGRCVRSRDGIVTSALLLRGAIAEALYEARFAEAPAAREPAIAVAPWFRAEAARTRDNAGSLGPVYALADCSAASRPDLVRAVLATDPDAAAEGTALQALYPVWRACLTPEAQLALDRNSIRSVLAEALYRWSMVQRDGAASAMAAAAAAN